MELLTPKDLEAEFPVLNRRLQKDLRRAKQIRYIRLGHRTVAYRRTDVEKFLASRCVEAMPASNGRGVVGRGSR